MRQGSPLVGSFSVSIRHASWMVVLGLGLVMLFGGHSWTSSCEIATADNGVAIHKNLATSKLLSFN